VKRLPFYLSLLLLLTCAKEDNTSSLNEQIEELEKIFNYKPPSVYYQTSIQNHEWNDGWYANNTHHINYGGTSQSHFRRGFTYFDFEGDGDMDIFACVPHFENNIPAEHLEYQIIVNDGEIGGVTQWKVRKDIIVEQLPYYATLIQPADLDNDGDMDIVIFIGDDKGNYGNTPQEPAGGIFAYIWEDGKYNLLEIEPYIEGGNQFFYHGGTLGDVNGDGFIDVLAGTNGKQSLWVNNGNLTFTKDRGFIELNNGYSTFVCSQFLFDLNKDGYLDLIVGYPRDQFIGTAEQEEFKNHVYIYFGKGQYPYYNDEEPDVTLINPYNDSNWENVMICMLDLSITDFDNDGDYDIFTNSYGERSHGKKHLINYYENTNNTFTFKNIFKDGEHFYDGCNSGFMKVYDIDNDGNKEILLETGLPRVSQECTTINGYKLIGGKLQKTRI